MRGVTASAAREASLERKREILRAATHAGDSAEHAYRSGSNNLSVPMDWAQPATFTTASAPVGAMTFTSADLGVR